MQENLKIIFMGTSDLAEVILNSLIESPHEIIAVVTQPDNKNKSRKIKLASPVKETALLHKLKLLQPEKLDSKFIDQLKELKPDLAIVAAYGKILPAEILEIPKFKSLNVHASLLPKLRGPSPIQNSLLQGDTETGITIMQMDSGIDTGAIIAQKTIAIKADDDYNTLTSKLAVAASKLLLETIHRWTKKEITAQEQDNSQSTLCQLIEKSDGRIFWDSSAEQIHNAFRAFRVWPGVFTFWENDGATKKLALTSITMLKDVPTNNYHLGEVFRDADDKICVQTGLGVIVIDKIQLEGKKEADTKSFINGYPNFIGTILK